ncbi:MAG: AAA family ATPase [Myxococcota bacterium]|nr:AAA family ATPase [Myxococcota bacterium]
MWRRFFGMKRAPFGNELEPDELFESQALREATARLNYLLDVHGIGLLTGEVGTGKTTVARRALAAQHPSLCRLLYVPNTTGTPMDLYKTIAWQLGLEPSANRAGLYRQIRDEVQGLVQEKRVRPVLVVDEAHLLRPDTLEELRLLTNYQMDSRNHLTLLFIAQPELDRRLTMSVHESLRQRLIVRWKLGALGRDELPGYLEHHLRLAGVAHPVFTEPAVEAIAQASKGVLRRINALARHALAAAAAGKSREVGPTHVEAAVEEAP